MMSRRRKSPNNGGARGLVTGVSPKVLMNQTIIAGPLGMGVLIGAQMIKTGLQNGNHPVTAAGAIICMSGLLLGYAVASPRSNTADPPNDAKAK